MSEALIVHILGFSSWPTPCHARQPLRNDLHEILQVDFEVLYVFAGPRKPCRVSVFIYSNTGFGHIRPANRHISFI